MRDHFAHGLVVRDHAGRRRRDAVADRLAVDLDLVAELDALADVGRLVVDGNAALENQLLHFEPRAEAGLRQHLVQFGRIGLGQQHALERRDFGAFFVGIELAGDDVREADRLGRQRIALLALGGAAGTVEVVFFLVGLFFVLPRPALRRPGRGCDRLVRAELPGRRPLPAQAHELLLRQRRRQSGLPRRQQQQRLWLSHFGRLRTRRHQGLVLLHWLLLAGRARLLGCFSLCRCGDFLRATSGATDSIASTAAFLGVVALFFFLTSGSAGSIAASSVSSCAHEVFPGGRRGSASSWDEASGSGDGAWAGSAGDSVSACVLGKLRFGGFDRFFGDFWRHVDDGGLFCRHCFRPAARQRLPAPPR